MAMLFWCGICNATRSQSENQDPSWLGEEILTAGKWLSLIISATLIRMLESQEKTPFPVLSIELYE